LRVQIASLYFTFVILILSPPFFLTGWNQEAAIFFGSVRMAQASWAAAASKARGCFRDLGKNAGQPQPSSVKIMTNCRKIIPKRVTSLFQKCYADAIT
jgi:hypothetical protein